MTSTDWHASPEMLDALAHDPTSLDAVLASSLEAHLLACDTCRQALAAASDPTSIEASWAAVAERIDRPAVRFPERALRWMGVDGGWARLLASTPGLTASGLAAIAVLAALVVAWSRRIGAEGPFLAIAPLLPLAAIAASFAAATDPAGEAGVATALHGIGLVARRAVVVLAITFALLGASALALPDFGLEAAGWMLPALALALGALALGTWIRIETAFGLLGGGWTLMVTSLWWLNLDRTIDLGSPAFVAATQTTALALTLLALLVLFVRRDRIATLEVFR
jgi:hypothetical protein